MEKIYKVIAYLNANGKTFDNEKSKFELTDDNEVQSITKWEITDLAQPTDAQLDALETEANTVKSDLEAEAQAVIDAKVSGNQKLLDLGLTQAEATALTGYTPPVAE
jgi:hypothetical protein